MKSPNVFVMLLAYNSGHCVSTVNVGVQALIVSSIDFLCHDVGKTINFKNMFCVIYVRVSTDKQVAKELTIPAQLQACRQYAALSGWQIRQDFVEPGASARTVDRPQLKQLLDRALLIAA